MAESRELIIGTRLALIKEMIAAAAAKTNRSAADIRLVCAVKQASYEDLIAAVNLGLTEIGENRLQEAQRRRALLERVLPPEQFRRLHWHMIGHLQSNKAGAAVRLFRTIQSVDNLKTARLLEAQAKDQGLVLEILAQVNISGESTKYGIRFEDVDGFLKALFSLSSLRAAGLMGMAAFSDDPEQPRFSFRRLRACFERENERLRRSGRPEMTVLSMGMSNDFAAAVEEGATMVRIGRALFEETRGG